MATLIQTATKLLQTHGTAAKAVKPFVQELKKHDNLLHELALAYLQTIKPSAPKPTEAKPTQEEGSVKVRDFEVASYRRRTHEEKQAALAAAGRLANSVYEAIQIRGTAIGDLRWGELRTLVGEHAVSAASHLREGKDATANAILLRKIFNYASVTDTRAKIRDVVPAAKIKEMIEEASIEAPLFIEKFMHQYADSLKTGQIEMQE
jgi:hypothetical protein